MFGFMHRGLNRSIAAEISSSAEYSDEVIQWKTMGHDDLSILGQIKCAKKGEIVNDEPFKSDWSGLKNHRGLVLLNGVFNHTHDIHSVLAELYPKLNRHSRVIGVVFNPYLKWLFYILNKLGIRKGALPTVFVTRNTLTTIASLARFEIIKTEPVGYFLLPGFNFLNRIVSLIPGLRWLAVSAVVVFRPIMPDREILPSLSIIIPARNEKGNIEPALKRLPDFGKNVEVEIVFVEGHSQDGTFEEIKRVAGLYSEKFKVSYYQQTGKGKSDAVRLGFSKAQCEILVILDADLTVPPEVLPRFYQAYVNGHGDFINGSRLVYPMEGEAMRFLNLLGNIFFARALSWILGSNISDSLCGTKLLHEHDYKRFVKWREDFGDFDPFGDFELLFPASNLNLGIYNIPVRYLARTYGTTNILRFRHGLMLLKMTFVGMFRLKSRWA